MPPRSILVYFQGNTSLDTDEASLFHSFVIYRVALKFVPIIEVLIDAFREILAWTRMMRNLFYSFVLAYNLSRKLWRFGTSKCDKCGSMWHYWFRFHHMICKQWRNRHHDETVKHIFSNANSCVKFCPSYKYSLLCWIIGYILFVLGLHIIS